MRQKHLFRQRNEDISVVSRNNQIGKEPIEQGETSSTLAPLHRALVNDTHVHYTGQEFTTTICCGSQSNSLPFLVGCGIRGGEVYGKSDKHTAAIESNPGRPEELAATIYHALDVPINEPQNNSGISIPITTGKPVMELFG